MERVVRARPEPLLDQRQYRFRRIRLRRQQRPDQRPPTATKCIDGSFSDLVSANISYTSADFTPPPPVSGTMPSIGRVDISDHLRYRNRKYTFSPNCGGPAPLEPPLPPSKPRFAIRTSLTNGLPKSVRCTDLNPPARQSAPSSNTCDGRCRLTSPSKTSERAGARGHS